MPKAWIRLVSDPQEPCLGVRGINLASLEKLLFRVCVPPRKALVSKEH